MNARQKARDLIRLAHDEHTSEEERVTAAVRACGLIQKYKLLDSPLDALGDVIKGEEETIAAVKTIRDVVTNPDLVDALKSLGKRFKGARESSRSRRRRR